ncbi:cyclin-Y-like protein 1 [Myotis myotis]|uniref:cyclin-Y-like protein 1 n=1 Tax=Myotis myotis TaxID=51298 RepID=UPI001749C24F|nr:cyclin-Y-like protein 1 [Myotis myotis]
MGNSKSCCLKASPSPSASAKLGGGSRRVKSKRESEAHEAAARDTGAVETVPAAPKSESTCGALKRHHLKNSSAPVTPQEQDKRKNNDECPGRLTKGYGSCPTVFPSDDTIRQPDFKTIIQSCVAELLDSKIRGKRVVGGDLKVGRKSIDIFNERKHPFRHEILTTDHFLHDPELKSVYRFVCALFSAEHLTAECAIVTLIFMERLLDYAHIDMNPTNWRRILLGSALLAYEYWDKQTVWGMDYCQLINNIITVDDM